MDNLPRAEATDGTAGRYHITWDAAGWRDPTAVFLAASEESTDADRLLVSAAGGTAEVELNDNPLNPLFRLVAEDGAAVTVAPRGIPFAGGCNFRDLGGYQTASGRRLRWRKLYRSGHISHFTDADRARFPELNIATVCDMRSEVELANENAPVPGEPAMHVLGIPPGVKNKEYLDQLFETSSDPEEVYAAMISIMHGFVREAAPFFAPLFEVLLSAPDGGVMLNCSAGKERTGVASLLVLSALGVPRETIMYDFMLSERYFPVTSEMPRALAKYHVESRGEIGRALMMPLLETHEEYLAASIAAIEEDCGSIDQFLRQHYGLSDADFARLIDLYTI